MPDLPPVTDRDHIRGPAPGEDAAHTLIQYGDFECPFSRQVNLLVAHVLEAFPGRVRFVFRHFPVRYHAHALHAAEAAEAAAAQGAFWPMHDRLFRHQLALSDDELVQHADALGLDARAVQAALREEVFREAVLVQKRAAIRAGVGSSLNLVIDGTIFQEDGLEDALLERVVRPLKDEVG
ncbi:MAG TPA: thioredoxin domain-containing protein [Rubricoccaceae bacterium]|nr:thioredoxin domain-containing protein [Rubricoccaceae bacterium]